MGSSRRPLPHWTWDDLEAALGGFSPLAADDPVRIHLMRGLIDDTMDADPREFLHQVLSAGWVMAQIGARTEDSATAPLPMDGPLVC